MNKRPNIVIFNVDQYRGDVLGHMGNASAITPNLDRIAAEDGVSFSNAYCQNPVCTPSRCSFMSGWYPHTRGHRSMYRMLHKDEPMLLKQLKDSGYYVLWAGKNDVVPAEDGFDAYCDMRLNPKMKETALNAHVDDSWRGSPDGDNYYSFYAGKREPINGATEFIDYDWARIYETAEIIKNPPSDKPLCIYLPLLYPHPPYGVEEPYFSMFHAANMPPCIPAPNKEDGKANIIYELYERQGLKGWTAERFKQLKAVYYGMCTRTDAQLGLIMDALKQAGVYNDTAIFFFSDHGDFTGDYGLVEKAQNAFEDCITRVPLVIKPPANIKTRPRITNALVELIDFCATVQELAGIVPDYTHFGHSLLPVLAGENTFRDAVFCEGGRLAGEEQVFENDYCTKESHYYPRISMQTEENPMNYKAVMCRTQDYKYIERLDGKHEFYDLKKDPFEQKNEINNAIYKDTVLQLKERLLHFYLETGDVVDFKRNQRE